MTLSSERIESLTNGKEHDEFKEDKGCLGEALKKEVEINQDDLYSIINATTKLVIEQRPVTEMIVEQCQIGSLYCYIGKSKVKPPSCVKSVTSILEALSNTTGDEKAEALYEYMLRIISWHISCKYDPFEDFSGEEYTNVLKVLYEKNGIYELLDQLSNLHNVGRDGASIFESIAGKLINFLFDKKCCNLNTLMDQGDLAVPFLVKSLTLFAPEKIKLLNTNKDEPKKHIDCERNLLWNEP